MSTDANKALIHRWFDGFGNRQNLDVLDELYAPDWVGHFTETGDLHGPEGHKRLGRAFIAAFPDAAYTVERIVAEGDMVAAHYTMTGTHQAELLGVQATGKPFTVTGINLYRCANGKIVEQWSLFDTFGLMRQLGAIPSSR